MKNIGQNILVVLWALLALATFACGIFVPMALGWKIVNFAFGIYNVLIILGLGWATNKQDKLE